MQGPPLISLFIFVLLVEEDEVIQEDGFAVNSKTNPQIKLQHPGSIFAQVIDKNSSHVDDCQFVFIYFPEFAVVQSKHLGSWNVDFPHL